MKLRIYTLAMVACRTLARRLDRAAFWLQTKATLANMAELNRRR